jgi:hypothetical protein
MVNVEYERRSIKAVIDVEGGNGCGCLGKGLMAFGLRSGVFMGEGVSGANIVAIRVHLFD